MRLGFEQPIYLVLLVFLPLLWWIGYQPLQALGRARQWIVLGLRSLLWLLVVLAMVWLVV